MKLAERPTAEWVDLLNGRDVPSGDILGLDAALHQPQAAHRKVLEEIEVPGIGKVPLFNLTAKLERTPGVLDAPPPRLGAHTEEVLGRIGVSPDRVAELRKLGAV